MDGDFFFVIGIVLVIGALAVSFFGVRNEDTFPPNRAVLVGVTLVFAAIVGTTMAFAVVKSVDEQDKRNDELAKQEQEAQQEAGVPEGGGQTLAVSSPADGSLVFQPDGLNAKPGGLTLEYDNPSPVPHSIALATSNGDVLDETDPFSDGKQSLDISDLKPGKYTYYCTVPGHREAGMEGSLTVGAGDTP